MTERIGLFADLHSNLEAFDACMEQAKELGVTRMIFLATWLDTTPILLPSLSAFQISLNLKKPLLFWAIMMRLFLKIVAIT